MVNFSDNYWTLKSVVKDFPDINVSHLYDEKELKKIFETSLEACKDYNFSEDKEYGKEFESLKVGCNLLAKTWWASIVETLAAMRSADGQHTDKLAAVLEVGSDSIINRCKKLNSAMPHPLDKATLAKTTEMFLMMLEDFVKEYPEIRVPRAKQSGNDTWKTSL